MKTVSIIPLKKGILKEELTYFTSKEICTGDIVDISVRNKSMLGIVASVENTLDVKSNIKDMDFNLKKINEVKGKSIFKNELIESIFLLSKYFVTNKSTAIATLIPMILREKYDEVLKLIKKNKIISENEIKNIENKIKSEKLLLQNNFEDRISFYKTLIRESFAKKKSIFLILPTEYDISNFSEILSKGIENFSIIIHGNLSTKKQFENIEKIITNTHPVLIIGTTPYLATPREDIGTIIVEHESSSAYKMISKPNFDLRIYAEIFASKIKSRFILADSLLSFETISRKESANFSEIRPLSFKTYFEGEIEIPEKEEKFKVLREQSITEIKNTLTRNQNVFIFSLRKGLASITVCKDCNQEVSCTECLAPLVLYISRDGQKRMFVCNRCKKEANTETTCTSCGSWNLVPLGIGTDTVYEECKKQFENTKIFKLDKEIAKTTKEAKNIIKEFEENKGSILIGTEMALYYIKNKISLSVIASFDSLWSIPNYKISEKIIQITSSIISKTSKKLIIQTKNEKDSSIVSLKNDNLLSFVREELNDRKNLGYPPYRRFIKINFLGDKEETIKAKNIIGELFKEYDPVIFSGFVAKQRGKYATNALVKLNPKKWSIEEISGGSTINQDLLEKLTSLPISFSISIDPEDLL